MHQYTHNAHDAGPHDILARSNVGGTATRILHRTPQFDDIGQCHFPPQLPRSGLPRARAHTHTQMHSLTHIHSRTPVCAGEPEYLPAVGAGADGSGTHSTLTHSLAHSSSILLPPPPSSPSRYLTSHNTCAISCNIVPSCRTADTS